MKRRHLFILAIADIVGFAHHGALKSVMDGEVEFELIQNYFEGDSMISRIWHGYTAKQSAEEYENLLRDEIFVGIRERRIAGYHGIQLLRRELGDETEFATIMWFESIDAVRQFAGDDYEKAVVPDKARALLLRFDSSSQHYHVRAEMAAQKRCTST